MDLDGWLNGAHAEGAHETHAPRTPPLAAAAELPRGVPPKRGRPLPGAPFGAMLRSREEL